MNEEHAFFPARSRLLVGIALLLVTLGVTWGKWYSIKGPLDDLAWFEQHRTPGDSMAYASALYHAAYAKAAYRNRWAPAGYGTLGVIGIVFSAGLLWSSRRRHTA